MRLSVARSEEPADEDPDERTDDRTDQCHRRDTGAPISTMLAERDHPLEEEKGFDQSGNYSRNHAGYNADQDAAYSNHPDGLRARERGFFCLMRRRVHAAGLEAFERLAADFARTLAPGSVVALSGELGSGKTTFVRAVVRALHGDDRAVASPTFVFRHRYAGRPPIEHLDLYRIEDPAEAVELGLEDSFDAGSIVLVEWPERLPGLLPAHAWRVEIEGSGESARQLTIERR